MTIELGYMTSETCNRNGCKGIIEEREKEGSCSCHSNPPCSHCVDDNHYCPECGWDGLNEQKAYGKNTSKADIEYYQKEQREWEAQKNLFYKKYRGEEEITKLEMRTETHTHFSQKVIGVFPKGTETRESLLPKVKGTFGGRFERFTDHSFEYIAYTD